MNTLRKIISLKKICTLSALLLSLPSYATDSTSSGLTPPSSPNSLVMGQVKIQFDENISNIAAVGIAPSSPSSYRSFLPACPAGTTYVSGVSPSLPQNDPAGYPYCNCFCKGSCGALNALTSGISGNYGSYSGTVRCSATLEGWFPSTLFASVGTNPGPLPDYSAAGTYYYCLVGSCSTNALPSTLGYTVTTGYTNTIKLDYLNCAILYTGSNPYGSGNCGAPA